MRRIREFSELGSEGYFGLSKNGAKEYIGNFTCEIIRSFNFQSGPQPLSRSDHADSFPILATFIPEWTNKFHC